MVGEIARGGMGVILKGHDTDLGRDVALKVLDPELAQDPAVVQRFIEEAQIGGQLQHPGIVPVYELGLMADERPYFTMKLVKGRTLAALLQQRRSPADERGRLLAIFESVCQTVAYAHSKGVLHRDLKPANVMVGAFGEVQVVDWGLAKVLHRGGVADEKRAKETLHTIIATVRSGPGSSGSDSLVGSVMGTPAYMAPEQAQGEIEKLDERADVFALGAILCEILTGRPPYEEREGAEPVVTQAARAELDPARERLVACEADPALVRLCLDCLTPARTARPANAEIVARAVHAYLTSVEERAHQAQLAAVEARVKAQEERRRRRLAVALAGAIVAALVLGGGGLWYAGELRDRRAEEVRASVESAQTESIELGRAGKPEEALAASRRALAQAESGGADPVLLERTRTFVARAEADVSAAERERELLAQDEALQQKLIELRLDQGGSIGDRSRDRTLDQEFAGAFQGYGIDVEGADIVPAFARLRERHIAEAVALALDDWGGLRRRVQGPKSDKAENLLYLAMDLDPDPGRMRLRRAILDRDRAALLELAKPESLRELEAGPTWVLSVALWDGWDDLHPEVYRIYDLAVHLHPDDYVIQSVGGQIYQDAGRDEEALLCRARALSLRPDDPRARQNMGATLLFSGRMTDAESVFRALLADDPQRAETHWTLGVVRGLLGDYAGFRQEVERAAELEPSGQWTADLRASRYYTGALPRAELARLVQSEAFPETLATYAYALLDHPDPAQRDPELVLRLLEQRRTQLPKWTWMIEAVARIRMDDWPGAASVLEGHQHTDSETLFYTPAALTFQRVLVLAHVGREGEAREAYARGMAEWNERTRSDPAAWEHSDWMRWRRAAEQALGM
jgi:serine/threonine-protein kinase